MDKKIPNIYNSLQEIAWHFGSHGINGECCGDLSFVDFMALKKVYENKMITVQGVGNALSFTKSGATRVINRLEGKGYVMRETSPEDARVCCVQITEKGTVTISGIINNFTFYLGNILCSLDYSEFDQIEKALGTLLSAINRNKPMNTDIISSIRRECV